jgi:hypothetical protein
MMVVLGVDPNLVRPGWTPLVVLLLLGGVLFLLGRSMIKQFGKIDVPADHDPATSTAGATPGTRPATGERSVTEPGSNPPIPDLRRPASAPSDPPPADHP